MDDINQITKTLTILTKNSVLSIDKVKNDEKNFGDVWINLKLRKKIDIFFIKDRGDFWCEIGRDKESFFLEDFFTVLGINPIRKPRTFIDMITVSSAEIIKHLGGIEEALNDNNFKTTQKKLAQYATVRAVGKFNL